jgi:dUTP pyrophosphatase
MDSAENTVVPAKGKALIATDLSIACPPGTYGRVAPRSGLGIPLSCLLYPGSPPYSRPYKYSLYVSTNSLAVKNFIDTGAGVVDEDYRGPLKVLLFNHSDVDFQVSEGDRIAQLVLEKIYTPPVIEVASLSETERGVGGFGSTGK